MKIKSIQLTNVRGFKQLLNTKFSDTINLFVGQNNSGKSTIINAIYNLQNATVLNKSDITIGESNGEIVIYAEGNYPGGSFASNESVVYNLTNNQIRKRSLNGANVTFNRIPGREPSNVFYPFLSKRKTSAYSDEINEQTTTLVSGNFSNLYAKIDRIITPQYKPGNINYINACKEILGFEISSLASANGKKGVYFVHNQEHIPLTAMGEGVANVVALIIDLCVSEDKIFLIEEPENDIHPRALKALMRLIAETSIKNQFFISTHSNLVMKYLGSVSNSKIFNVDSKLTDQKRPNLFISTLNEIKTEEQRKQALENLGYDISDWEIWDAWLFLEESSAEILIREWFIKWFTPSLIGRIRTFSSNSLSKVKPKFDDFNSLFVFLHLEPVYKNKVWVIVDSGEAETKIIEELKSVYCKNGWDENCFTQFNNHDFESFYPDRFQNQVKIILEISDKDKRRKMKKELLNEVKDWIKEDEKGAKIAFKESAKDVIEKLKMIEKSLLTK